MENTDSTHLRFSAHDRSFCRLLHRYRAIGQLHTGIFHQHNAHGKPTAESNTQHLFSAGTSVGIFIQKIDLHTCRSRTAGWLVSYVSPHAAPPMDVAGTRPLVCPALASPQHYRTLYTYRRTLRHFPVLVRITMASSATVPNRTYCTHGSNCCRHNRRTRTKTVEASQFFH